MRSLTAMMVKPLALLQHAVFTMFLCLGLVGCSLLSDIISPATPNKAPIPEIQTWSRLQTAGLASSTAHLGDVLTVREIAQGPTQVVSAGADGNVLVWSLDSGTGHLLKQVGGPMQLAAFGERRALLAWNSGSSVHVVCLAPGCGGSWELSRLKTRFSSLAFHEDDSALLIGGADGRVYRWRFSAEPLAETMKERDKALERYVAHQTSVTVVQSLPTGRAFFSGDWDGILYGWLAYTADDQEGSYDKNLFGGRLFGNLGSYLSAGRAADRGITSMGISADGARLAIGSDDGFVEIWEVRGFKLIARKGLHTGRVIGVSLNASGSRVVSVGRDSAIHAEDIVPDPSFGISPSALPAQLIPVLTEQIKSVKTAHFLSSGNVLISTSAGQLGELALASKTSIPSAKPTRAPLAHSEGHDSDY